jgi:hypothetical protein
VTICFEGAVAEDGASVRKYADVTTDDRTTASIKEAVKTFVEIIMWTN